MTDVRIGENISLIFWFVPQRFREFYVTNDLFEIARIIKRKRSTRSNIYSFGKYFHIRTCINMQQTVWKQRSIKSCCLSVN